MIHPTRRISQNTLESTPGSPDWLVDRFEGFFENLHKISYRFFLVSRSRIISMLLVLAAVGSLLLAAYDHLMTYEYLYYTLRFRLPILAGMLLLGPALLLAKNNYLDRYRTLLILAFCLLMFGAGQTLLEARSVLLNVSANLIFPIIAMAALLKASQPLQAIGLVVAIFLINFLFNWLGNQMGILLFQLTAPERMILPLSMILAESQIGLLRLRLESLRMMSYLFSPLTLLFPLPASSKTLMENEDRLKLFISGLGDFTKGTLALTAATFVDRWIPGFYFELSESIELLIRGSRAYLFFFLSSFGLICLATGCGRWLGFKLPDGFHYPLLAASPMDRWRRWNTYYYFWSRSFVFFPVLRRSNSLFLAVFLTFIAIFFLHETTRLIGLFDGQYSYWMAWTIRDRLLFFIGHGFIVYLGLLTHHYWPDGRSLRGWWGVAVTHILMILLHTLVA